MKNSGTTKKIAANGNGHTKKRNFIPDEHLHIEILQAIKTVGAYGSIEVYIQDHHVTQITTRRIRKTKHLVREIKA